MSHMTTEAWNSIWNCMPQKFCKGTWDRGFWGTVTLSCSEDPYQTAYPRVHTTGTMDLSSEEHTLQGRWWLERSPGCSSQVLLISRCYTPNTLYSYFLELQLRKREKLCSFKATSEISMHSLSLQLKFDETRHILQYKETSKANYNQI